MKGLPLWTIAALALLASACEQIDYIELEPATVTLKQKNNMVWMQAHAMSHTHVQYPKAQIAWSVKDGSVAQIDPTGKLTPVRSGMTEVTASHGKVKASIPLEVLYAEKLSVEPATLTLVEGGPSVELHAKAYDYRGRELRDRTATFSSKDQEVVSMGQNAAFPVNAGKTQVVVRVEELSQTVEVTVEPAKGAKKK